MQCYVSQITVPQKLGLSVRIELIIVVNGLLLNSMYLIIDFKV